MENSTAADTCAAHVTDLDGSKSPSPLLDVFPESEPLDGISPGTTSFSTIYRPSGSTWQEGLDETQVFLLEMEHTQDDDENANYCLRIGRGGQIYSLRGCFGESTPPSWRDPSYKHMSPWNDEVWQFVAVCMKYNDMPSLTKAGPVPPAVKERFGACGYSYKYFVHNSGSYISGDIDPKECTNPGMKSLYCPLLGVELDDDGRSVRTCNFGLVPQVRTMHRSPLLYYCQTRDLGEGIVELTWVVHNFSARKDLVFDHLNAPWGGTRVSALPHRCISLPDGRLIKSGNGPFKNVSQGCNVRETGGYNVSSVEMTDDSPALALVFGRDKHLEREQRKRREGRPYCQFAPSFIRDWRPGASSYEKGKEWSDWRTRPDNTFRNYDVSVIVPKFRLEPGSSVWYRSYLVANKRNKAVELASKLVDKVDYGLMHFSHKETAKVEVELDRVEQKFLLSAKPINGSMPLFLMSNATTGEEIVSTDPYHFVPSEPLSLGVPPSHPHHEYYSRARGYSLDKHNTRWKKLLGYGRRGKPRDDSEKFKQLSDLLDGTGYFPDKDAWHLDLWVELVE